MRRPLWTRRISVYTETFGMTVSGKISKQAGGVQDLQDIQILSDLADQHGCGNCGELTAISFMYLYNLNIRPLDFMALENTADHAFVVIGRRAERRCRKRWT